MELTTTHLNIIKEAIVKLDCYSCEFSIACHNQCKSYGYTFCSEIGKWLKDKKEEIN